MEIARADLAAGPPAGSVGEFFRFYFTRGSDPEVFLTANRRTTETTFSLRQQGAVTRPLTTGSFHAATNEVVVSFTPADYATVLSLAPVLATGDRITVGQVLAQRDTSAATLTADTAAGSCPFVLGVSTPVPTGNGGNASASPSASAGGVSLAVLASGGG